MSYRFIYLYYRYFFFFFLQFEMQILNKKNIYLVISLKES